DAGHPLDATGERLREGGIRSERLLLEPQAEDRERRVRSLRAAADPCAQAVAPQDGKRVVAELALRGGRVDLPDVVEVEQRRRAVAGADGAERSEECRLVGSGGGARLPGPRHATALDRRDVVRVFGKRPARAAPPLDLDLDEGAGLHGVVAPR